MKSEKIIQERTTSYSFYVPAIPIEYAFLDNEGNEI